jgi:hypothetical protein
VEERRSVKRKKRFSNLEERRFSNVEERRFSAAKSSKKNNGALAPTRTAPPQFVTPASQL